MHTYAMSGFNILAGSSVCERVCVCICVCVCVRAYVCVCVRERLCMCVSEIERV